MTTGRLTVIAIVVITILFGIGVWYASTRAYYEQLDSAEIGLQRPDGSVLFLEVAGFEGIDAETSPLRFRACFAVEAAVLPVITPEAMAYEDPTPLTAPNWFDCFDAAAIGADLEAGEAQAWLGLRNIERGVDRVVALYPDGRAYAWHQLNGTLE